MTRRNDGRWQERVNITINGERKTKYFYGKTKAEVLRKIQEFNTVTENGKTFEEVAFDWKYQHWEEIASQSIRNYNSNLQRAVDHFGTNYIKDITPQDVDAFLKRVAAMGYSQKTLNCQRNVLNMIFNHAVFNNNLSTNPCQAVKTPKGKPKQRRTPPTNAELEIIEKSDWLLPYFLLYTGCRLGEALALRYEDIDREQKIIHINKSLAFKGNQPFIKEPKTEAGKRDIILLDKLAQRLPNKKGLIFYSEKDKLYNSSHFRRDWKKWKNKYNIDITPHQLRHGYATLLFEAGLDVKDAQGLLGHSTIAMTQDVYTHIRQARLQTSAEKLNSYIDKM